MSVTSRPGRPPAAFGKGTLYMFLDYLALGLLFFVGITLFYGLIAVHDIPYEIAKHRNHPQQDAIHVAGWISLFTLHTIWPFLWIWATLYREDRGWGFQQAVQKTEYNLGNIHEDLAALNHRLANLERAAPRDVSTPAAAIEPVQRSDKPFGAAVAHAPADAAMKRSDNDNEK